MFITCLVIWTKLPTSHYTTNFLRNFLRADHQEVLWFVTKTSLLRFPISFQGCFWHGCYWRPNRNWVYMQTRWCHPENENREQFMRQFGAEGVLLCMISKMCPPSTIHIHDSRDCEEWSLYLCPIYSTQTGPHQRLRMELYDPPQNTHEIIPIVHTSNNRASYFWGATVFRLGTSILHEKV